MVQVTQRTFPPPPLPHLFLSAYPFMDSLHPYMSIFPICDMRKPSVAMDYRNLHKHTALQAVH